MPHPTDPVPEPAGLATDPMDRAKSAAAAAAVRQVRDGMTVGLGSGSTAAKFILALGHALTHGTLQNVRGIPTSRASEALARTAGIPIVGFDAAETCDVTIDGADEVSPTLDLIKGLGGALLREKIVAQNSRRLLIIVDSGKLVDTLGTRGPLPVEVVPFARDATERFLRGCGCVPTLRLLDDGSPFVTDNGNHIYHCRFDRIDDPAGLDRRLRSRAGVVESGLFVSMADEVLIAGRDGVRRQRRQGLP